MLADGHHLLAHRTRVASRTRGGARGCERARQGIRCHGWRHATATLLAMGALRPSQHDSPGPRPARPGHAKPARP